VQYSEVKLNCHRTGHGVLMSGWSRLVPEEIPMQHFTYVYVWAHLGVRQSSTIPLPVSPVSRSVPSSELGASHAFCTVHC
jgi:hypothetical protein